MIPLTLIYGTVQKLIDCTYATPLEYMMVALSCPIMCLVFHTCWYTIYSSHEINFLHYFGGVFGSGSIPRRTCSTPYFVLGKHGFNGDIIEAKVRKLVMQKLALYLIQPHPKYNNFVFNLPYLHDITGHGIIDNVIIFYDKANCYGLTNLTDTSNGYSGGNINSTVPIPHVQELEKLIYRHD